MQNRVGRTADLRPSVLTGGGAALDERAIREAFPRVPLDVLAALCFANVKSFLIVGESTIKRERKNTGRCMNAKTLLKVTLNEALDPELFEYLARFENPRLRVGALRALASAGAHLKHINEPGLQIVQMAIPTENAPSIDPARESVTASPSEAKLSKTASIPQFLDEDIGDQFARF